MGIYTKVETLNIYLQRESTQESPTRIGKP